MNDYIVGKLLETGSMLVLGICFLLIIIASFYDVWMTSRRKVIELQTRRLGRNRPHVTVLVYVKNGAAVVSDCVASIIKSRYRQYDIVIVNNQSTDQTKLVLARFKQAHPTARLYVYNKRKASTVRASLRQAYRKSQRGRIVLTIRSDNIVSRTFIKEAVAHFRALGSLQTKVAVIFNERFSSPQTLMATVRYFPQASRQLLQKVASLTRIGRLPTGNNFSGVVSATMYESSVLMREYSSLRIRYIYDSLLSVRPMSTVQVSLFSKRTFKELMLFYLTGISLTLYVTYAMYMAATLQNTALLLLGWLVVVVWFFAAIWFDETSFTTEKLKLSFVVPSLYFFLYVMTALEVTVRAVSQLIKGLRIVVRSVILFYASEPISFQE